MKLKELWPLIDRDQNLRVNITPLKSYVGQRDDIDITTMDLNKDIQNIYTDYSDLVIICWSSWGSI